MALVDFTNPDAARWFQDKLRALLDRASTASRPTSASGSRIDVVWHDGSDPERMHNYYTQLYNEAVFEVLEEERGDGEAVRVRALGHRRAASSSRCTGAATATSTFESMAETLRGGLSLALLGLRLLEPRHRRLRGHARPGRVQAVDRVRPARRRTAGCTAPARYRVPWLFDEEAVDVTRDVHPAEAPLMPYLVPAGPRRARRRRAGDAADGRWSSPTTRPSTYLDRQYMLGSIAAGRAGVHASRARSSTTCRPAAGRTG